MLWVGGDPRSLGPAGLEHDPDETDWFTTAMDEVCYSGGLAVLRRFQPEPSRALFRHQAMILHLLDLGADPNDKRNGGSSAMDRCLASPTVVQGGMSLRQKPCRSCT